jgi:hypothetical protein
MATRPPALKACSTIYRFVRYYTGAARWLLLTASVLAGLVLAVLTIHRAGAWAGSPALGH